MDSSARGALDQALTRYVSHSDDVACPIGRRLWRPDDWYVGRSTTVPKVYVVIIAVDGVAGEYTVAFDKF